MIPSRELPHRLAVLPLVELLTGKSRELSVGVVVVEMEELGVSSLTTFALSLFLEIGLFTHASGFREFSCKSFFFASPSDDDRRTAPPNGLVGDF